MFTSTSLSQSMLFFFKKIILNRFPVSLFSVSFCLQMLEQKSKEVEVLQEAVRKAKTQNNNEGYIELSFFNHSTYIYTYVCVHIT